MYVRAMLRNLLILIFFPWSLLYLYFEGQDEKLAKLKKESEEEDD
jgi:hypothetical protein